MAEREYTIILEPDADGRGYTVTVPALPGVVTEGATLEAAIAMAREGIALHVEGMIADGEPVPEEREHVQAIVVKVPTRAAA